ncbi:FtsX-like permease family protein [Winogradskyella sp.]|uniref:ABC transporter permease n=1 Tax=Winogradskyella sp. TaxID=1883156 RepID=UPI003BAD3458
MLKSYIKIAVRSLMTNRLFSAVNIFGLSVGLATTLILFLFILHERSFDSMYANKDRIYRVILHTTEEGLETWANVPSALSPELTNHIPDIEKSGRLFRHDYGEKAFIKTDNAVFSEDRLFWAEASLIEMLNIEAIKGIGSEALKHPNNILLSESTAKRYFGEENPLGKTLSVDNRNTFEVKGIFKDFPENSSFNFNAVVPFLMQRWAQQPTWGNASFETFVKFNTDKPNITNVENQIQDILNTNVKKEDQWYRFSLQPLERVHLYSSSISSSYIDNNGDINQIKNLTVLAVLILIIACINYMNLMTARSQKRAKDVGVNKTLGASNRQLIFRFYIETGLITAIAMVLGTLLAIVVLPMCNDIIDRELSVTSLFSFNILLFLAVIWLLTTIISGSYPALYLSRFSPQEAMKPSANKRATVTGIRKSLVVVQFSASVVLIIAVLVIYEQLQFMQNKDLGFNPENVIAISTSGVPNAGTNSALVNAFEKLPNVSAVTRAQGYPSLEVSVNSIFKPNSDEGMSISTNMSEHDITDALQLKLLAGRPLPKNKLVGDTLIDVVINKTAIDFLGFSPEEAIGRKINVEGFGREAYIRGVVSDFNFTSLHKPIGAYAFYTVSGTRSYNYLLVRFTNEKLKGTLSTFESTFNTIAPNSAFEYTFLDKKLETLYKKEQQMANVSLLFSVLAIVVACLGLFALAAFMAEQRQKEIGIRKVFGASVSKIVRLLSHDFLKLVLISFVISFPLALYAMNNWLQNFAYRIHVSWTVFLIAGVLALAIALFAVGYQAIKAAIATPISALRSE